MITNIHNHTWRCMHATGTEREYIEQAIAGGQKVFGFSDHSPMPYKDGYVSRVRMTFDQLEDYCETVLRLKKEYESQIEIHLGLETEYYPRYFEELRRRLRDYPIEYLLLGQHFLGDEIGDLCSFNRTRDASVLERYCRQTAEGLSTGAFTYLCHPDLMPFLGEEKAYETWVYYLLEEAKKYEVPLEINLQGVWDERFYPHPAFWRMAGEVGNVVLLGTDAHHADKVWVPEAEEKARKMAADCGVQLVEEVSFQSPWNEKVR